MNKFTIKKIEAVDNQSDEQSDKDLVQRLYDLGLHPGLEVEVIAKISFNSVTVIQYGATRIALNHEEFLCLHGH